MRRWRWAGVSVAAGAILLALPSIAGATRAQELPLVAGQGVTIVGSKIQCSVGENSGYGLNLSGKTYIVCGPSTNVKGGGYVALMDSDGRVYVLSIKTHKTVSVRTPASAVRAAGTWKARLHDQVIVGGEPMICSVITLDNEANAPLQLLLEEGSRASKGQLLRVRDQRHARPVGQVGRAAEVARSSASGPNGEAPPGLRLAQRVLRGTS